MSERPIRPQDIEQARFPFVRRGGYDPHAVDQFLANVAADYQRLMQRPPAPAPQPSPRSTGEVVGTEVASIIDKATQTAEELRASAEREAYAIRTAAIQEAAEASLAAKKQLEMATESKELAEREADAIRSSARNEASRLEQEARELALSIEQEAREKADRVERAARANVAAVLSEGRARYEKLRDAQQETLVRLSALESLLRQAREEAGVSPREEPQEALSAPVELHRSSEPASPSRRLGGVGPEVDALLRPNREEPEVEERTMAMGSGAEEPTVGTPGVDLDDDREGGEAVEPPVELHPRSEPRPAARKRTRVDARSRTGSDRGR